MSLNELVGQSTTLTVARKAAFGYFLTDGNEDVLLHINQAGQELAEGDEVEVFLYVDSQGRTSASTTIPEISVDRYAWVKVTDTNPEIGVFLNIGLPKDILLGADDLPVHKSVWPKVGDLVYVTLRLNRNYLLYARLGSDQIIQSISVKATREDFNKNVQGHIYRTAKVGSWVYTIEGFKGFIHESQRPKEPRLGEMIEGRIIDVKEDGTVNISLLARKEESQDQDAERIFEYLLSRNGAMPFSDKSMPEDIQERFGLSKGAFKRALGKLMKEGRAYQEGSWTYVKKD
ncbi:Conserved virulence factor B [Neobacillus rhizosphaerae]|uniref:Conserved virulence factor B n=1 Tax=Neobacillus rhizosphaerae TaxID=2880965 RepID=A0ABM9ELP0_9BACI|nr:S1-like domain-containing RNA-binding protein [Neobacillus rhizosphaerae]CAH2713515.1 Conserved virulence factor B [Neobacillus rhizosphaerae]